MPYINAGIRESLDGGRKATQPGELNYQISKLCSEYLGMTGISYTHLNAVIGVLESAKMEIYRRIVAPYEEIKRGEHGEVYTSIIHPKAD